MKKVNSKIWVGLLIFGLISSLWLPGIVFAQSGTGLPLGKGIGSGNFCAKIKNSKIDQQIANQIARLKINYQTRWDKISSVRTDQIDKLATQRTRWETNHEKQFSGLRAKAETDAEKAAVEAFIKAVNAAILARKTAVDAAITTFRTGVDKAIAARKTALINVSDNYYKAVKGALDQARLDCAKSGADNTVLRTAFIDSLKTAKAKMQTEKVNVDKLGETIQKLSDSKKAALTKAVTDFKTAVEAARAKMQLAFQ
ncbi:MAG: hypothetical protein WC805_01890 [Patescibacteria group bacterium]|jgi:hypothetical protein